MRIHALLQAGASWHHSAGSWKIMTIVPAGMLVAVGLSACAVAKPNISAPHAMPTAMALEPRTNWVQPLRDARHMTLSRARVAVGFAIPMPDVSAPIRIASVPASQIRLRLSQVWEGPGRELALIFDTDKVTVLVGRAQYKNPGKEFRQELAAIHVGRGAIGSVRGRSALVIQPRTDYIKANPALVEFYLRGLDIEVLSTRVGTATLLAIASSIRPGQL